MPELSSDRTFGSSETSTTLQIPFQEDARHPLGNYQWWISSDSEMVQHTSRRLSWTSPYSRLPFQGWGPGWHCSVPSVPWGLPDLGKDFDCFVHSHGFLEWLLDKNKIERKAGCWAILYHTWVLVPSSSQWNEGFTSGHMKSAWAQAIGRANEWGMANFPKERLGIC